MKISLFQGILLGIFGFGALIGLVTFATYSSSNKGGSAATVGTVVIWGTLPHAAMDATLSAVAQVDKNLKSVSYVEKNPATLKSDLATAIATGNGPDLVLISQENLLSVASLLQPIPATTLSASSFQSAFVREGQLFESPTGAYGVPFLVDPLVLFNNRTILSSNGIPRAPTTWEALTGLVPKIAALTSSGNVTRSLIALGTYDNVRNARGILSALFLQTGVPLSTQTGSGYRKADLGNRSNQNGVPPGQAVLRFYTQFADPSKVSYTWDPSLPDSRQAFIAGDLALYLGYSSEVPFLKAANPNLDFGVSELPQPSAAGGVKTTYGLLYALATPRGAKNATGAYQAAALLTNSAEQQAASTLTGLAPAALTALSTQPTDPLLATAYTSALYANGWLSPMPADTDQVFSSMIQDVISGRLTLDAALASAERSLSALIQ